jgi:hypothetical protein
MAEILSRIVLILTPLSPEKCQKQQERGTTRVGRVNLRFFVHSPTTASEH